MPKEINTLTFPNTSEGYIKLAKYNEKKGEYDSAIRYAYDAIQHGGDREELICFIASALLYSGNADEAMRLLLAEFYDPDNRPTKALTIISDCYRTMHEYIQERRVHIDIKERGIDLKRPNTPDDIERALDDYDAILNDNILFGTDISSLDDEWCDIRPIMEMCAVLAAVQNLRDNNSKRAANLFEKTVYLALSQEPDLPSTFVVGNVGTYIMSEVMNENPKNAMKCVESFLEYSVKFSSTSVINICALTLVAALSTQTEEAIDNLMKDSPTPAFYEIPALASVNMLFENTADAISLYELDLKNNPFSVGANRAAAYCYMEIGNARKAYAHYDRMSKILPWDKSIDIFKQHCLSKLNDDKTNPAFSEENELPLNTSDRLFAAMAIDSKMTGIFKKPIPELEAELDDEMSDLLVSFIPAIKDDIQFGIINTYAASDNEAFLKILKRLLLDKVTTRKCKDYILRKIIKKYPKKKVSCCVEGNFIEAFPRMHTDFETYDTAYESYRKCYGIAKHNYNMICVLALNSYYEYFIRVSQGFATLDEDKTEALAAKLLTMAVKRAGYDDKADDIINTYYADVTDADITDVTEYLDASERGYIYDLYCDL